MIGRIFWDFLQEKYWADQVAHKIQKKLSKIRVRKQRSRQEEENLTRGELRTLVISHLVTEDACV